MFWPAQEKVVFGLVAAVVAAGQTALSAAAFSGGGELSVTWWAVAFAIDVAVLLAMVRYAQWAWKKPSLAHGIGILLLFLVAYTVPVVAVVLVSRIR